MRNATIESPTKANSVIPLVANEVPRIGKIWIETPYVINMIPIIREIIISAPDSSLLIRIDSSSTSLAAVDTVYCSVFLVMISVIPVSLALFAWFAWVIVMPIMDHTNKVIRFVSYLI